MSTSINKGGSNDPNVYRDTALTNVVVGVTASAANLTGYNIINDNAAAVYVKFYDSSSGTVVLGTTAPVKVVKIANAESEFSQHEKTNVQLYFPNGISVVSVTGLADSDTTAPATATYIEVFYDLA